MSETVYVSPEATAEATVLLEERTTLQDRQEQERAALAEKHSAEIADWFARWNAWTDAHRGETLVLPDTAAEVPP